MRIQDKNSKRQPSNIHASVESGDLGAVQRLLSKDHSLLNQKSDTASETPLHVSAAHDKIEITKYLLEFKGQEADLDLEAKNAYGETPLHIAAKNGFGETLSLLLHNGANVEAKTKNSMTPLHLAVGYALRTGEKLAVKTLLEFNADRSTTDEEGMSPSDYLPIGLQDSELLEILSQNAEAATNYDHTPQTKAVVEDVMKSGMEEFEKELSKLVGQNEFKSQLRRWAKGLFLDEKRRAMGLELGPKKRPHMAFLGNPGTGKANIARIVGRLLSSVGVLSTDTVTQVKCSELVGLPKQKTTGGILYVDEAHHLAQEEKAEITSVMEGGEFVVILAGSTDPMKWVFESDPGFCGLVAHSFEFDDLNCGDLAHVLMGKMAAEKDGASRLYGFKLHPACTYEAVVSLIEKDTTEELRRKVNGGLVDKVLSDARENLDSRLSFSSSGEELLTITLEDLEAGIRLLGREFGGST